jgi:hypothetical protein
MTISAKAIARRQSAIRRAAADKPAYEVIGEVEAVTRMVVAATGEKPHGDEAYTGRRLMPLSLPRLKFLERKYDAD